MQFWCYGSTKHLEEMSSKLDIPLVAFHRLERYEGKNMLDALGSLLKRKMRAGALQNKNFDDDAFSNDLIDNLDPEDLVFENHASAFSWINKCFQVKDSQPFSEKFKTIKLLWVEDEDIPRNLVVEKNCRKIKNIKQYNCAVAVGGQPGVYVRDSTCSFCENCACGNVLQCTETTRNGCFFHHVIDKSVTVQNELRRKTVADINKCESDYSSEDGESDEEEEVVGNLEDCTPGKYLLIKLTDSKYYGSLVVELNDELVILKGACKYGESCGKLTFVWPHLDDIFPVELSNNTIMPLPDPTIDRRGSSFVFRKSVFRVPTSVIM